MADPMKDKSPPDSEPLSYGDLSRLRVDSKNRLLWMGEPVQVQKRVTLSRFQAGAAAIVAIGTLFQGLLAGFDFFCRLSWISSGCPK